VETVNARRTLQLEQQSVKKRGVTSNCVPQSVDLFFTEIFIESELALADEKQIQPKSTERNNC
jgi:hypothetical protein